MKMHKCAAVGCLSQIRNSMLMCITHWRLVPLDVQELVYRTFKMRKRGGRYEGEYYNAVKQAVEAVRVRVS